MDLVHPLVTSAGSFPVVAFSITLSSIVKNYSEPVGFHHFAARRSVTTVHLGTIFKHEECEKVLYSHWLSWRILARLASVEFDSIFPNSDCDIHI